MVMEGVQEDYTCSMQCTKHIYKKNSPAGGICVFCLQEKLGKLVVSSPFPLSNTTVNFHSSSSSSSPSPPPFTSTKKSRIPFLSSKKKNDPPSSSASYKNINFHRSKSSVMPRVCGPNFTENDNIEDLNTPLKSRLWKLIHFSQRHKHKQLVCMKKQDFIAVETHKSPLNSKVLRSRSVGCGSRRISGDFFGDCILRRVESQREGKPRERVNKCGGLFSGFSSRGTRPEVQLGQGRGRSWAWSWALPSPIMGFRPTYSGKRYGSCKNGAAPKDFI